MKNNPRSLIHRALVVAGICMLWATVMLPLATQASPAALLPPLPTLPAPTSPPTQSIGGLIELRAQFSQGWPWETVHWGMAWTVVQWQDEKGRWHDVEGWRGELDEVEIGEDGMVVGIKTWWLAESEFGKGPFRWVVYLGQGGALIGTSEAFDLPEKSDHKKIVEVSLRSIQ